MDHNSQTAPSHPEVIYGADQMPDETLDIIFGELHDIDDGETLTSCTLVCRQWARVAYPHRFQKSWHEMSRVFGDSDETATLEDLDLAGFIQSLRTTPRAAHCIKEFQLFDHNCTAFADFKDLRDLVSSLPSLQTLLLHSIGLLFSQTERTAAPVVLHPLRRLKLEKVAFNAVSLHRFLGLFTAILSIDLYGCEAFEETGMEEAFNSFEPPVNELILRSEGWASRSMSHCIPILSRVLGNSRLRSLECHCSSDLENHSYNLLVGSLGHGLKSLTMSLSRSQAFSGHIDLSCSSAPENLHLLIKFPYHDPDNATFDGEFLPIVWPSLLRTVATTPSSLLKLSIYLQLEYDGRWSEAQGIPAFDLAHVRQKLLKLDWTPLVRVVTGRDTLQEVRIVLQRFNWHDEVNSAWAAEVERAIHSTRLRSLRANGKVKFTFENRGTHSRVATPIPDPI